MAKRIMVSPETSQEIRDEVGTASGTARTKLVKRIAKRLGFSPITIEAHSRKTPTMVAASTVASTKPRFAYGYAPTQAVTPDTPDTMADLISLQVNLAEWTRRNEDYSITLQTMAYTIDTAIEALESTRRLMGLEEENQDLGSKLKQADAQIQRLKDIIDKQAEATRRNDNPHIRGD